MCDMLFPSTEHILDISDICDLREHSNDVLLAAYLLSQYGERFDFCAVAVESNAWVDGWSVGMHGLGSEWPGRTGIRFSPEELQTVVRLGRYFAAREAGADIAASPA
jgi:hypothetical protein